MKEKAMYICPYECPLGKRCLIVRAPNHAKSDNNAQICPVIAKIQKSYAKI